MIHFLVPAAGSFSIRYYLAEDGAALADRMRVIEYDELPRLRTLALGAYVFAGVDTLSEPERELAGLAWDRLRQAGAELRLLNDPRGVASRYELLRRAHEAGLNAFRAVPAAQLRFGGERGASASECAASLGYPVFVRYANRHEGSLTPLIDSPAALERALALLLAAGNRLDELLVVEFCDTRDEHGVYRKYAAFMVGERVLSRCLECAHDWMVKWEYRILDAERASEESAYLAANPHESWIRDVFRLAGAGYGRIDYGVLDGRPQVWEINTNPTIGRGPGPPVHDPVVAAYKRSLAPGYDTFYQGLSEAWLALDASAGPSGAVELDAPESLRRAASAAIRRRRSAERRVALVRAVLRPRWLRPVTRGAKRALALVTRARLRRGR